MKFHSLDVYIGSALLMLSLFLPLTWNFISETAIWCFPLFDAVLKEFSFSPSEYRCYPVRDVMPYYFSYIQVPIYLLSKSLIPEMNVRLGNVNINVWSVHITYVSLQSIDLFLSFSQFPYFRTFFIVVGIVLQVKWLVDSR